MTESAALEGFREHLWQQYRRQTPRSAERCADATQYMAGGGSRASCFFEPYPLYASSGSGPRLEDLDGNVYLDFVNNFTVLVHGHAYPPIAEAIARQASRGVTWAAFSEAEVELARLLCQRVPSLERVRFCNSGTEAAMHALRLARAVTGRRKILKMEGGFHGTYEPDDVITVPYGDGAAFERALVEHAPDLAAVIIEPVMGVGGMIPAPDEYLRFIRELTARFGTLLIFDEIITFRLAPGGVQARVGVTPDLTLLGKAIGGGLPVAALGGRADIMRAYEPVGGALSHTGTYNGNVLTMTAGLACLLELTPVAIERMNRLGERLRAGFEEALREFQLRAQITGVGSLLHVHMTPTRVHDYASASTANKELFNLLHLALLTRGVFTARRGMFNVSSVMGEEHVDAAVAAFRSVLAELQPLIVEVAPELSGTPHVVGVGPR